MEGRRPSFQSPLYNLVSTYLLEKWGKYKVSVGIQQTGYLLGLVLSTILHSAHLTLTPPPLLWIC